MKYLKFWKYKKVNPEIQCPAKQPLKNQRQIITFPDKQKLKESVTSRPALQDILE